VTYKNWIFLRETLTNHPESFISSHSQFTWSHGTVAISETNFYHYEDYHLLLFEFIFFLFTEGHVQVFYGYLLILRIRLFISKTHILHYTVLSFRITENFTLKVLQKKQKFTGTIFRDNLKLFLLRIYFSVVFIYFICKRPPIHGFLKIILFCYC